MEVYLAAVQAGAQEPSVFDLIFEADLVVQLVLVALVFMSVACWAIILQKMVRLRAAARQSAKFLDLFWASKRLDLVYEKCGQFRSSPVAEVFRAGYQELAKITSASERSGHRADATDNLQRTLRRAAAVESTNLERYVTFLATTGSTAPFIGLLGTVWGILRAFQKLGGGGQATIDVVGPDIAHALIATAVGLFAAIPAVIAYNYFNQWIRVLNTEMDNFSADFLNIVKRHVQ
ncbi:MAG: biopolymer transport protein TolQ [Myxococcota bacterium]|jgi:biopolymer transport protein TolQ